MDRITGPPLPHTMRRDWPVSDVSAPRA